MTITKKLRIYLRPYRLRWGLSQDELTFLMGLNSRNRVCNLERGTQKPSLADIVALGVIFGTKAAELFPALVTEVEEAVLRRANDLYERLQGTPSRSTPTKLDCLEEIFDRAEVKNDDHNHDLC